MRVKYWPLIRRPVLDSVTSDSTSGLWEAAPLFKVIKFFWKDTKKTNRILFLKGRKHANKTLEAGQFAEYIGDTASHAVIKALRNPISVIAINDGLLPLLIAGQESQGCDQCWPNRFLAVFTCFDWARVLTLQGPVTCNAVLRSHVAWGYNNRFYCFIYIILSEQMRSQTNWVVRKSF